MTIVLIKPTSAGLKRREIIVKEIFKITREENESLKRVPCNIESEDPKVIKGIDQSTGDIYVLYDTEATIAKAIAQGEQILNVNLKVVRNWIHRYKTVKRIEILKVQVPFLISVFFL